LGLSCSCGFGTAMSCVGQWFQKRRALAVGVTACGSAVGNLFWSLLAEKLLSTYGWRTTFRILSVSQFCLIMIAAFLMKRNPASVRTKLPAIGWMLKHPVFVVAFTANAFSGLGFLVPYVQITPYAIGLGLHKFESTLLLSIMGISSIIGRLGLGLVADSIGSRVAVLRFDWFVMASSTAVLPFLHSFPLLCIYSILYGTCSGSIISISAPMLADYFGIGSLAGITGIYWMSTALGNLLVSPGVGTLYDRTGSYRVGFLATSACFAMSLVTSLMLPGVGKRNWLGLEAPNFRKREMVAPPARTSPESDIGDHHDDDDDVVDEENVVAYESLQRDERKPLLS